MKKIVFMLAALLACSTSTFAQGAKNIKINEVLTDNQQNLQDEFGAHLPWVELTNTSFSTYNVRGMFITTDRNVLNPKLTAPQRIARMSIIPNEEERTQMSAREHLILYLNSNPAKGALHLKAPVEPGKPMWIALYDGNGIDLIDSVSVPALGADKSFARIKDGFQPEVLAYVAAADFGVLPSTVREACPLSAQEYLSQGRPVVSTNQGGQCEYLADGSNALLVPPDPTALADAMRRLATDTALCHRLGLQAKADFGHHLTYDHFYTQMHHLYQSLGL